MSKRYLRDLLYFDFDKATSLWSQLAGGLREKVSVTAEAQQDKKKGLTLGIPKIAEVTFGGTAAEKLSTLESKVLHHDLLNTLEGELARLGLLIDLNSKLPPTESSADAIRSVIGMTPYVLAQGWSAIEDYQRIHSIAGAFNPIAKFVATCAMQSDTNVQELIRVRGEKQRALEAEKDKNKRNRFEHELKRQDERIDGALQGALHTLPQWLIEGLRLFIDTFMRNRINFRLFPFDACPAFQLICNLKRDCFVDQDLEHLLYGYGNRPTLPLAVLGLVTEIPTVEGHQFDPLKEFKAETAITPTVVFEKAFREMFGAMEALEAFVRYARYPNISVHPIAVFRQIELPATADDLVEPLVKR